MHREPHKKGPMDLAVRRCSEFCKQEFSPPTFKLILSKVIYSYMAVLEILALFEWQFSCMHKISYCCCFCANSIKHPIDNTNLGLMYILSWVISLLAIANVQGVVIALHYGVARSATCIGLRVLNPNGAGTIEWDKHYTVDPYMSEHHGTGPSSDMWYVQIYIFIGWECWFRTKNPMNFIKSEFG